MRLGAKHVDFSARSANDLESLCDKLDSLGLSAIQAPEEFWTWTDDQCWEFGQKARSLGLVIGEHGYWENLLDPDQETVNKHIRSLRTMLRKAEIMGIRCVATLVGSRDVAGGPLSPHPFNFSEGARSTLRDICHRVVDGLNLTHTRYAIEPWCNTFFHTPDDIFSFIRSVGDPRIGFHLDQMNMVSPETYFHTTSLINRTFDLLAPYIVSVHAKDIRWDPQYKFMKMDEVYVGDGVLDYNTFLRRLSLLDPDLTVYTEHFQSCDEFTTAIDCLHQAALQAGVFFRSRDISSAT